MKKSTWIITDCILWAVMVFLDQLTKIASVNALKGKPSFVLIRGVLEFYYLENHGAAFSLFEDAQWFFFIIATAAIVFIAWMLHRIPKTKRMLPLHASLLCISAGAAGNLIDRVMLGYVRDFIYFSLINFPVFNVADIFVTVATFFLIIEILFVYKDEDFAFMQKEKKTS